MRSRILDLNDQALRSMKDNGLEGIVRLEAIDDYATVVLPGLLKGFLAAYPHTHLEKQTGLTVHHMERIGRKG